jgi:hypothetical protein
MVYFLLWYEKLRQRNVPSKRKRGVLKSHCYMWRTPWSTITWRNENFKMYDRSQIQAAALTCLPVSWDRKTLCWAQQCKTLTSHNLETSYIIHGRKFWYGTANWLYEMKLKPIKKQCCLTWMLEQEIPGQGRAT